MNYEREIEEDVIFLDVPPPPPPPKPLIAPDFEEEIDVFPPTPPETIILKEELKSKN